jgi:hypothetical protein
MKKKTIIVLLILFAVSILVSKPESSSWDGVAYCVKSYLKSNLHDPKSLKIQNAYTITRAGEDYIQRVKYRAKNAFGALILEDKVFFMGRVYNSTYNYGVYEVWSYDEYLEIIKLMNG